MVASLGPAVASMGRTALALKAAIGQTETHSMHCTGGPINGTPMLAYWMGILRKKLLPHVPHVPHAAAHTDTDDDVQVIEPPARPERGTSSIENSRKRVLADESESTRPRGIESRLILPKAPFANQTAPAPSGLAVVYKSVDGNERCVL